MNTSQSSATLIGTNWAISQPGGTFEESSVEDMFQRQVLSGDSRGAAILIGVLTAILLTGIPLDLASYTGSALTSLLITRAAILMLGVVATSYVLLNPGYKSTISGPLIFIPLLVLCYCYLGYVRMTNGDASQSANVIPIFIIFCFLLPSSTMPLACASSAVILFLGAYLHGVLVFTSLLQVVILVFSSLMFTALGCLYLRWARTSRRKNFQNMELLKIANDLREQASEELKSYKNQLESMVRDRTEKLQRSEQNLQIAQRMETMGQLAGGIAHDFNNLLTIILSYSELATMTQDVEKVQDYVAKIDKAAGRGADMTRQLLAFSRRQMLNLTPVNIVSLAEDVSSMVKSTMPEDIHSNLQLPDTALFALADYGQLEQVIINLILNARDSMPNGGALDITVGQTDVDQERLDNREWATPGEFITIEVKDNGSGISREALDKIFEPFFTTKASGKGTGLGLAVAFGTVKQLNGFIEVESEPGVGSKFRILLPLVDANPETIEDSEPPRGLRGSETILIVDDEQDIREVLDVVLGEAGYKVLMASDGEEGLAIFRKNHEHISLVLLDVVMPGLGGRDVMKQIQSSPYKSPPIIFMSGYTDRDIRTEFIPEDELTLIPKPFSGREILQKIREVLD